MDCLPLLRISARLLDLHDSERETGSAPEYAQEERRGRCDGHYLDLATAVLDVLRQHAHASGNAFLGFDALLITVRDLRPGVEPSELRYVLNVLARPSELWTVDRSGTTPRVVSDKATALVEKTYYADDYRLAPAGRMAIAAAANVSNFAYAEGDALKLLRAIESGDFTDVPRFCDLILDSIRYESVDVRMAIEKGLGDTRAALYRERLPRYQTVVKQSSDLIRQAEAQLRRWLRRDEAALDDSIRIDLADLTVHVLRVYQALESFGRELAELTSAAAQQNRSIVPATDFLEVALRFVRTPLSKSRQDYLLRQFGPVLFAGVYPSPAEVAGKVRMAVERSDKGTRFDTVGAVLMEANGRIRFLDQFGAELLGRLEEGPLPLSEAIDRGWCVLDGEPELAELLGLYSSPWTLGDERLLQVRVPGEVTSIDSNMVGSVLLANLELTLLDAEVTDEPL